MATAVKHRKEAFRLIISGNWRGGWSHKGERVPRHRLRLAGANRSKSVVPQLRPFISIVHSLVSRVYEIWPPYHIWSITKY